MDARPTGPTWKASEAAKRSAREAKEIFMVDIVLLSMSMREPREYRNKGTAEASKIRVTYARRLTPDSE